MKSLSIAATIAIAFAGTASVQANEDTNVWAKDFKGKPPFQRSKETTRTADMAKFEVTTEVVKNINFNDRSPFSRNVHVLRIIDANRLEIVAERRFVPAPRRGKI